jgi:hypothetical protein
MTGDFHDESRMARETDARERGEIRREQDARWGAPEDAMPALEHPAQRAIHATTNVLQILYGIRDTLPLIEWEAVSRAIALLSPVPIDVAALQNYIDVQEANIAGMIEESNQTHRDLSATHEKCAALLEMLHDANVRATAAERKQNATAAAGW